MNPFLLDGLFGFAKDVINKIWPDPAQQAEAQFKLLQLKQSGELAVLAAETDLAKGQIEVNKVEASSQSLFVAGWRPFVGWVSGFSLAYAAILEPMARFVAAVAYKYSGAFPVIDTTITMQILFGLLGLGMMRSYDKKNGQ
jgi:hypothetical protein